VPAKRCFRREPPRQARTYESGGKPPHSKWAAPSAKLFGTRMSQSQIQSQVAFAATVIEILPTFADRESLAVIKSLGLGTFDGYFRAGGRLE
jgi:hypothetical protein